MGRCRRLDNVELDLDQLPDFALHVNELRSLAAIRRASLLRTDDRVRFASRFTAGAFGFLTLTQSGERPRR